MFSVFQFDDFFYFLIFVFSILFLWFLKPVQHSYLWLCFQHCYFILVASKVCFISVVILFSCSTFLNSTDTTHFLLDVLYIVSEPFEIPLTEHMVIFFLNIQTYSSELFLCFGGVFVMYFFYF